MLRGQVQAWVLCVVNIDFHCSLGLGLRIGPWHPRIGNIDHFYRNLQLDLLPPLRQKDSACFYMSLCLCL